MAGPSLGWGIALQERFKNDYEPNRVVEQAAYRKQERDRQDEKALVDELDFKIDHNKYLPVYGKAIASEQANIYNKYAQYRQQDRSTAKQRIQLDIVEAKRKIGEWERSNEALKKDMALGPEFLKDNNFLQTAAGANTTFEQLNKISHPLGFYAVGPNGEYTSMPGKAFKSTDPFKPDDMSMEIVAGSKPSDVPGKALRSERRYYDDKLILAEAERRAKDPDFIYDVYFSRPDLFTGNKEQDAKNLLDAALIDVKRYNKETRTDKYVDLPNPPSSGSGDKRIEATPSTNTTKQIKILPEGQMHKKTVDGKEVFTYKYKDGTYGPEKSTMQDARNAALKVETTKVHASGNLPNAKAGTITASKDMLDVDNNEAFGNLKITGNFDIKPTGYEIIKKTDGRYHLYVIGPVVKNVGEGVTEAAVLEYKRPGEPEDSKKTEKIYNVAVPYEKAKDLIDDQGYDMTEVLDQLEQLNLEVDKKVVKKGEPARSSSSGPPKGATEARRNPKTGEMLYLVNGKVVRADGTPYK